MNAALAHNIIFAVAHVMRYTSYTQQLKHLIISGVIGELVSIQHLEPVGYWHYAHSFVRGNWRNEFESSCMLLAKSCHDVDWLRYMIGHPCVQVSSFGSLMHFRMEAKPKAAGEAKHCLDCAFEPYCPYLAKKFYLHELFSQGRLGWPLNVITTDFTAEGVLEALRHGPYGRCVYECDNDVVDHQVVNLLYADGTTASFTMVGTSEYRNCQTSIFGTLGELWGDGRKIIHNDYFSGKTKEIVTTLPETSMDWHGGGDYNLMQRFVAAVADHDASGLLSGATESLETHLTGICRRTCPPRKAGCAVEGPCTKNRCRPDILVKKFTPPNTWVQ